eukprot:scaffold165645_cov32-Prasinocladus_malaysianus.AAC.1
MAGILEVAELVDFVVCGGRVVLPVFGEEHPVVRRVFGVTRAANHPAPAVVHGADATGSDTAVGVGANSDLKHGARAAGCGRAH